jgi:hypothetical protein
VLTLGSFLAGRSPAHAEHLLGVFWFGCALGLTTAWDHRLAFVAVAYGAAFFLSALFPSARYAFALAAHASLAASPLVLPRHCLPGEGARLPYDASGGGGGGGGRE